MSPGRPKPIDVPSGPAMRRPVPTRPWYVRVLESAGVLACTESSYELAFSEHTWLENGLQKQKASSHWSAAREKKRL